MSSSYRMELDRWLSQLEVDADSVLDIGGSQLPVNKRTKSWNVKSYTIADLEQPHVDSPKPDVVLDLNYENDLVDSYDLIFCLEVFDYIWNPAQAFETIEYLLAAQGVAWVTFPFVYPTHQPIEDDALRYAEGGIRKLAAHVGLEVEEIIPRRPDTNAVEMLWHAERMRAAKHYNHAVTGWIVKFRKPTE
jgi:SAM-dependent methyltransferase